MIWDGAGCPFECFVRGLPLLWTGGRVGGLRLGVLRRVLSWGVLARRFRLSLMGRAAKGMEGLAGEEAGGAAVVLAGGPAWVGSRSRGLAQG